jgi:hypothetical protein
MFGKHFERMYQGSMRGAGADVFAVWGYAISHARPDSLVEMNSEIVAFLIGMPQQRVEKALEFLQSPDPKSRNKEYEGRRMVKRGEFEYFLPSLAYYRGVKSLEDLREYNRVKQRESRERRKGFVETEESETEVEGVKTNGEKRSATPELEEVKLMFAKSGGTPEEAEKFFNFYSSKGWMVGKTRMKSVPHAVAGWILRNKEGSYGNYNGSKNAVKVNPRLVGVTRGPSDYAEAFRRRASKSVVGQVAETGAKIPGDT